MTLNVKVGDKKFVMGTLLSESIPQTCFDMLFDQEFELSHNWGKGSVHFVGFQCPNNKDEYPFFILSFMLLLFLLKLPFFF